MLDRSAAAVRPLCRLGGIPENGAKGVEIGEGPDTLELILMRRGSRVSGYLNSCPHRGTPLDTFPDKFLDQSGNFLVCSTHGARFRAEDGLCVWGPCKGASLAPVILRTVDGQVWLSAGATTVNPSGPAGMITPKT